MEQLKEVSVLEVLLKVFLRSFSLLVDRRQIHTFLVNLTPVNLLFDCAHSDESVNYHILFLTNTEDSINSLIVISRIPIRVEYDGSICSC